MSLLIDLIKKNLVFIRFLIVGGLNTAFGYFVFAIFIWCGLHYSVATFLSTVIGIVFNFFTTGRLVFKNSNNRLIFKFFAVYGITWLINVFFIWLIIHIGYDNLYVIGLVQVLPMALISYVLMKNFVFNCKTKENAMK